MGARSHTAAGVAASRSPVVAFGIVAVVEAGSRVVVGARASSELASVVAAPLAALATGQAGLAGPRVDFAFLALSLGFSSYLFQGLKLSSDLASGNSPVNIIARSSIVRNAAGLWCGKQIT